MTPMTMLAGVDRGGGDERLVHVLQLGTHRSAHAQSEAVVVGVAQDERLLRQMRRVFGDHLGIHHESARGDDHRVGPDYALFARLLPRHACDRAVGVDDELTCTGLVPDLDAEFAEAFDEQVDDE